MALTGLPESKGSGLSKAFVAIVSSIPEAISVIFILTTLPFPYPLPFLHLSKLVLQYITH
jgi:hypothetical protein